MPTAEKEATVTAVSEMFARSKGIFLTDFSGLNVGTMTDLRSRLRKVSSSYLVVKNRLTAIAADQAGFSCLREYLKGPTGIVFTEDDPTQSAKILADFTKQPVPLKIKSGIVEKTLYTGLQVEQLASIPSREVLLTQVVTAIQGPLVGLVVCLQAIPQKLVGTLHALAEKRQAEEKAESVTPEAEEKAESVTPEAEEKAESVTPEAEEKAESVTPE
ncbi:MAG: 50S ribosomal protein L10 [Candidatus Latescibacteria bacterium]|nr:50S ribosomal protein L10 [Candidatus Latescibacterota bacterium]